MTTTTHDFIIRSNSPISSHFIERNITTFAEAAAFITQLRYGRNPDKTNLLSVFSDNCGTCSTKHALLKMLADENEFGELKLILGMVRMDAENTPEIAATLERNNLDYIPEAHNYLKYKDSILDYTKPHFMLAQSPENVLEETEITPQQITDFKVAYHKKYLEGWLEKNTHIRLTPAELWTAREECIRDLGT